MIVTEPPPPEEIVDPDVLKAFRASDAPAHLTVRRGPASATTLAAELGVNTGATSYHLRELAKHGFVEEDPGLGHGKEQWERARRRDLRFPRRGQQARRCACCSTMSAAACSTVLRRVSRTAQAVPAACRRVGRPRALPLRHARSRTRSRLVVPGWCGAPGRDTSRGGVGCSGAAGVVTVVRSVRGGG
ncbi:winged helix-turn-helix domain-containing protein [Actinophytocola xanthii]|nr:winged helix-turn-helix domain-containing protein [Actinophytocola xanthii]